MNENLDLTKILEGCPKGIEFYSSVYGTVTFVRIGKDYYYPIELTCYPEDRKSHPNVLITKDGRARVSCNGECILFPSKKQRDWSKFKRFWDKPKIKKFNPNTLQPFDKVLVKDYETDRWTACLYSHTAKNLDDGWFVCDNTYWHYIIPYTDDTKHLVGTKNDCPEYYKWWEK